MDLKGYQDRLGTLLTLVHRASKPGQLQRRKLRRWMPSLSKERNEGMKPLVGRMCRYVVACCNARDWDNAPILHIAHGRRRFSGMPKGGRNLLRISIEVGSKKRAIRLSIRRVDPSIPPSLASDFVREGGISTRR